MKSFFTTYQPINLLTTKSARNQGTSSLFQRLRQTKQEIKQQLLPRDFEQFARRMRLIYFFSGKTENHILFILKQLGCPRFKTTSLYSSWKMAKLTPIFKKDDATETGNYRPISLLSILSKIIESEVNDTLLHHVFKRHRLASHRLCAYRQGYSTEPLLVHRTETCRKAVDSGLISYNEQGRQNIRGQGATR